MFCQTRTWQVYKLTKNVHMFSDKSNYLKVAVRGSNSVSASGCSTASVGGCGKTTCTEVHMHTHTHCSVVTH